MPSNSPSSPCQLDRMMPHKHSCLAAKTVLKWRPLKAGTSGADTLVSAGNAVKSKLISIVGVLNF